MSQVLLESRWDETKDALLEGLKGTRRSTMGVVLENTRKGLLNENATAGSTSACLLYTSPSPRDATLSRMPSSA